jgi:uncharacterized pyridoxal phosphate-dependent enzyme
MVGRRGWLRFLGMIPGLGMLSSQAQETSVAPVPDYFKMLGVKPFINAAGTYTALTASMMPPEVQQAWNYAAKHYVHLSKLHDAVGARIAELIGAEAAMVSAGAASAMTVGTAGVLTGTDITRVRRLPDVEGMKHEVLTQKRHRFAYDHALRATGAKLVEIEGEQELEAAIGPKTAMMLFFNDASPLGGIPAEEWARLGKKHGVPTFNDCAADVPPVSNLSRYLKMGFDLVAFSGGKGMMGPQSAGLLLGRKDLIEAARLNTSPNSDTIGRGMKVNKEELLAMMVAVESYLKRDHAADLREWNRRCDVIASAARRVPGVQSEVMIPPVANHVPHLVLRWDTTRVKIAPPEVKKQLAEGEPAIEACPLTNAEALVIGVWMMQPGETETVARRVGEILQASAA